MPLKVFLPSELIVSGRNRFVGWACQIGVELLAIDFHGAISPATAKLLIKALEPYQPMFVEEPCQAQNHDVMACQRQIVSGGDANDAAAQNGDLHGQDAPCTEPI